MILTKDHTPGTSSLGTSNGLAEFAQSFASVFAPTIVRWASSVHCSVAVLLTPASACSSHSRLRIISSVATCGLSSWCSFLSSLAGSQSRCGGIEMTEYGPSKCRYLYFVYHTCRSRAQS